MPTDDLKIKDFWQLSPDEQIQAMQAVKPMTVQTNEYLVRGVLIVERWEGGAYATDTIEVVAAQSPYEALNIAWDSAIEDGYSEDCEDCDWEMTSIKMLMDVEIEYPHLVRA